MMQDTIEAHEAYVYLMNRVMFRSPQVLQFFAWVLPYGEKE
jgi:phosphosulfolactate synthase (CoM biosynthesis protein A)